MAGCFGCGKSGRCLPCDTVVDNGDGTITITQTDGTSVTFTAGTPDTFGDVVSNGDGTATITFPGGATATVCEGCTIAVANPDGSVTITNPDGTEVVIPAPAASVLTDNGDGTWTHDDGNGNTVTWSAGSTSSVTGAAGAPYVHDDGNGATTTIEALDNGDGSADILGCKVSAEKVTLCIDEDPGVAVHTKRITDLKTGVETDYVFSGHLRSVNTFNTLHEIDDTISIGPPDFDVITPVATMPAWGCPTLTGTIRLYMQLNADANPIGAPAENLNFRYRINGGGWLAIQPLTSYSPTLIGIAGATGSNQTNQELIITGARYDVAMPTGATLEFGVAATNPFDPGEGLQLQAVWGVFEYIDLECEAK